ncbi:MAG: hypothetical protein ACFE9S_13845 [Candidatus Hermodarchaeota archaeon]
MSKITEKHDVINVKECSRCLCTKPLEEFGKVGEYVKQICKVCQNELNKIREKKTKSKIILEFFNGKCYKCDTDISSLPALDFHHLNNRLKTISYWKLKGKSYNNIINSLIKESVIVLCANCHILENATLFSLFKDFILDENIYQIFPKNFERELDNLIRNHEKTEKRISQNIQYIADTKFKIKVWIKKRLIIEKIYDGFCIGCGKISIQNNLPSFNFHHQKTDKKDKGNSWRDIRGLSVEKITEILYQEKCICLCANCHRMLHDINFKKNYNHVLNDNLAKKTYFILKQINDNVNNFKFHKLTINNPFRREYKFGEIWKKYLLIIYYISRNKTKNIVETTELREFINRTRQNINKILAELIEKNLIKILQEAKWIKSGIDFVGRKPRKFKLTEKAEGLVSKLLKEYPKYRFCQ